MKIIEPTVSLEWATPSALKVIEEAGRTAYKSDGKGYPEAREAFIHAAIKRGHESVLEHASASFRFICDRGVTHELVRHRLCAFTQESTRFCNYSGDKFEGEIRIIVPPGVGATRSESAKELAVVGWFIAVKACEEAYMAMIKAGFKPQIARSILPNCLKTEIVCTANFREWRHILKLRTALDAHPQIREVMLKVLDWFREKYMVIVEDILYTYSCKKCSINVDLVYYDKYDCSGLCGVCHSQGSKV